MPTDPPTATLNVRLVRVSPPWLDFRWSEGSIFMLEIVGEVVLVLAAEHGHEEMVGLTVGTEADVDGFSGMDSPVRRAMMYVQRCVVNTLLGLGAKKINPSRPSSERVARRGIRAARKPNSSGIIVHRREIMTCSSQPYRPYF